MNSIDFFFNMMFYKFGGTDFASVVVKLSVAAFLSGIIGLERNIHKQNAGLRTYILVCIGACIAMMTDQFIVEYLNPNADPARLGAQVITGVGFLGAGTIVLAGRQVIGLTTAAGLWASACIGLAVGTGFYAAGIMATILIFIALELLPYIEKRADMNSRRGFYHIELSDATKYMEYREYVEKGGVEVTKASVSKTPALVPGGISFRLMVKRPGNMDFEELTEYLEGFQQVYLVEEL